MLIANTSVPFVMPHLTEDTFAARDKGDHQLRWAGRRGELIDHVLDAIVVRE
jgi:hypothetical protein